MEVHEHLALANVAGRSEAAVAHAGGNVWERRQAAMTQVGRATLGNAFSDSLFVNVACTAAKALEIEFAGAVRTPSDGQSLIVHWGQAENEASLQTDSHVLPSDPHQSAWAFALRSGQPLVIDDLKLEARFVDLWLPKAGAAAGIICPLAYGRRPVGALGVFSARPRKFASDEVGFVDSLALMLTSATARHEAEHALADQAQFLSATVDQVDTLVVVLTPTGAVEKCNDACHVMTGYELNEIRGKPLWESLLPANQAPVVQQALDRLRQGEAAARIDSPLRTRDGSSRRIAWNFTIVQRDDGRLQAIVGNGVEEMHHRRTAEELREIDDAQKSQDALADLESFLRDGQIPPVALLEKLIEIQQDDDSAGPHPKEKRARDRRPYPYLQRLAPWEGGRLPPERAFVDVRCRDISASGFSYFVKLRPNYDRVVVEFGPGANRIHVIAEVRHVTPFQASGPPTYLVGCEFLARVYY